MIKIKEKPSSLAFCSGRGDLMIGIGTHVFRISHKACESFFLKIKYEKYIDPYFRFRFAKNNFI